MKAVCQHRFSFPFFKGFPFLIPFFWFSFQVSAQQVISIDINTTINPASTEFIQLAMERAQKQKAECLLVRLNTPGGLMKSTREIAGAFLQTPVPVVVYVAPGGAHAGSAGVFITMAATIAAMAPGTNIGAAHPVAMQGKTDAVMDEKQTSDAAAFIRAIAKKRNRNAAWAEQAVRLSVALTETEALENGVIDLIAGNETVLLNKINGRQLVTTEGVKTLHTQNARIEKMEMGVFLKLLNMVCDPSIAYMLMMLGFFGLLFELMNPGAMFPGIAGVIFLVFAFYAMSFMTVDYAGVVLILFGILLLLLEIKITSHGLLAIGGIASVLAGSLLLFRNSPLENIRGISFTVLMATTIVTALFFLFIATAGLRAQKARPVSGTAALIGKTATTLEKLDPAGQVLLRGEIWNAVSLSSTINSQEQVVIKDIKNLTLYVERPAAVPA